jgi:hypothetical protein
MWKDERGGVVSIQPGFSFTYTDAEAVEVFRKIHLHGYKPEVVGSELGSATLESFAVTLLRACVLYECPIGIERKELEAFTQFVGHPKDCVSRLLASKMLRAKLVEGLEVIFPTEELFLKFRAPVRERKLP